MKKMTKASWWLKRCGEKIEVIKYLFDSPQENDESDRRNNVVF